MGSQINRFKKSHLNEWILKIKKLFFVRMIEKIEYTVMFVINYVQNDFKKIMLTNIKNMSQTHTNIIRRKIHINKKRITIVMFVIK